MNSNKIINLVDFYQSLGVDFLIDDINKQSLQNMLQQKNLATKIETKIKEFLDSPLIENIQNESKNIASPNTIKTPTKIVTKKELDLSHIKTLDALKEEVLKFEECSLKKTAINTVFGCGNENSEIMVIGEAPGAEEDEAGEPFVGRSGKLLISAMQSIELSRDKLFITNTIFWRPPGNRNPTIEEMELCYPFIKKMIEIINPKIIIIVGKVATTNLIKTDEPIGKIRGKWYNLEISNKTYLSRVVFHPSYLIRSSTQKKSLWLDLLEIRDKIKTIKTKN
jgi:uracil-DNA glycosylase family 4